MLLLEATARTNDFMPEKGVSVTFKVVAHTLTGTRIKGGVLDVGVLTDMNGEASVNVSIAAGGTALKNVVVEVSRGAGRLSESYAIPVKKKE